MADDHKKMSREDAERRVRETLARRKAATLKAHDTERQRDFLAQKQELDRLKEKETALREQQRKALDRLDRDWQRQRDRLGNHALPAPAFGMMLPQRNLSEEYKRARAAYEAQRSQLEERFGERLEACHRERADKLDAFRTANQAREEYFADERARREDDIENGFETFVNRQMLYGNGLPPRTTSRSQEQDRGIRREFSKQNRLPDRDK